MKCCLDYNLLERVIFKAVARKAKCINIKELSTIFFMLDSYHFKNYFTYPEFKSKCDLIHSNLDDSEVFNSFKSIDVNNDDRIE